MAYSVAEPAQQEVVEPPVEENSRYRQLLGFEQVQNEDQPNDQEESKEGVIGQEESEAE